MIDKTFANSIVPTSTIPLRRHIKPELIKDYEQQEKLTIDQAKELVINMNHFLKIEETQLRFQFHEELNEYYVTVIDSQTGEVIREIPPKRLMDIYAAMCEFIGVLVDQKI